MWIWRFAPIVLLVTISLLTLRSIDIQTGIDFNFSQQIIGLVLGVVVAVGAYVLGSNFWQHASYGLYGVGIVLLLLTLTAGDIAGGAQRWLEIGPLRFQTSEFMKLGLIMAQARLLSRLDQRINSLRGFGMSAALTGLAIVPVILQPDLGTAITFLVIWGVMIAFSRLSKLWFGGLLLLGIIALPLASTSLAPYQQDRLTSFLSSDSVSFNVQQAQVAISNGGVLGQGLDGGTQSQLEFIPSQHTDFIFSVIVEKLGAVGGMIMITAFVAATGYLILASSRSSNEFGRYILLGTAALIGFQFIINVGMNLGLVPVTGLPLPFVSFGSTHVVIELLLIGIAVRGVDREV